MNRRERNGRIYSMDAATMQERQMVKRVLSLILGFGMITAGVAGFATTMVDQRNTAALAELDKARDRIQIATAEEQNRQEEKRQEIEELKKNLEAEKQRLEEERRATEQIRRAAEALIQEQKRAAKAATPAPSKEKAAVRQSESGNRQAALPRERRKPAGERERLSRDGARGSTTAKAPKPEVEDEAIRRITHKAGMEAARSSLPVKYFNHRTREFILAEPVDYGPDSVRVRIRLWRNDRLIKDKVINFSETSLDESRRIRA
jgi:flagellar biosynthesis GTPase FlhF